MTEVMEFPASSGGSKFGSFKTQGQAEAWRDANGSGRVSMTGKWVTQFGKTVDCRKFWVFVKKS